MSSSHSDAEGVSAPGSHLDTTVSDSEGTEGRANLNHTLDKLVQQLNTSAGGAKLARKAAALRDGLKERAVRTLTSPVDDWDAFNEQLSRVRRFFKQGLFVKELRDACLHLLAFLAAVESGATDSGANLALTSNPSYWKARTLIYELHILLNIDTKIPEAAYRDGESVLAELKSISVDWVVTSRSEAERALIREKVLFCTCRGNELKRRGDTNGALKLFRWLQDFTEKKLTKAGKPHCFATQANLCYHIGSLYRVLEKHGLAEEQYTKALDHYYQRTKDRGLKDLDDNLWVTRRQAMCIGLGFGWIDLTRGNLNRAHHQLTTARSMLSPLRDNVIAFYVELLYQMITRCRAGSDEGKLIEAIKGLEEAWRFFHKEGHSRYEARVCWELALAFSQAKKFDEAEKYLNNMEDYEKQKANFKWQTNIHVLRSRIQRGKGNFDEALSEAQGACTKAEECEEILPKIDARITRGEAYFALAKSIGKEKAGYATARADFEQALQLLLNQESENASASYPSNPKIVAVCELHIARCLFWEGSESEARKHLDRWRLLEPIVEHGWVRSLATEVKSEIVTKSEDFHISAKDPGQWDYSKRVSELRNWLLKCSLRQTQNNWSEAAKLIGVERATLYQWQLLKGPTKRARVRTKS
jgi:tetratricopeptide (TPR) repeat protein